MISMRTIEAIREKNYTLGLYCISCNRLGEANLDWLVQIGKGDKFVVEARFMCRDCGAVVEKQIGSPAPRAGRAVAYI